MIVTRLVHVELAYHVLGRLDLGRDAASLFDPRREARSWQRALGDAYRAAPGRLAVQWIGLYAEDLDDLFDALHAARVPALEDPAGRTLSRLFAEAVGAERAEVEAAFCAEAHAANARATLVATRADQIERVRQALWGTLHRAAPELEVVDCASLRRAEGGTHGRAVSHHDRRRVAISLAGDLELAVCQLLHEEMHPISDRAVTSSSLPGMRDTTPGTPGFALHARLEGAAIELGRRVIGEHAPELAAAYARWCQSLRR